MESYQERSLSAAVKVVVTVTNKDENGLPVFRGQTVVDIQDNLLYFKRVEHDVPLDTLCEAGVSEHLLRAPSPSGRTRSLIH